MKNKFNPSLAILGQSLKQKKSLPKIRIPKEIFLFILSFGGSFLLFTLLTQSPIGFNMRFSALHVAAKPTVAPTQAPTPTAAPTPEVKKDSLKVKVLNGSGTVGKASEVKTALKDKGYQDIVTGNADEFNFATTEIAVKKGKEYLGGLMKDDLVDYAKSAKITVLDDKESADIVVTVGKDFK